MNSAKPSRRVRDEPRWWVSTSETNKRVTRRWPHLKRSRRGSMRAAVVRADERRRGHRRESRPAMIHVGTSGWSFTTREARCLPGRSLFSLFSVFPSLFLVTCARERTRRSTLRLLKLRAARFCRTAANGRVIFGPKTRSALVIFGRRALRVSSGSSVESCTGVKSIAIY